MTADAIFTDSHTTHLSFNKHTRVPRTCRVMFRTKETKINSVLRQLRCLLPEQSECTSSNGLGVFTPRKRRSHGNLCTRDPDQAQEWTPLSSSARSPRSAHKHVVPALRQKLNQEEESSEYRNTVDPQKLQLCPRKRPATETRSISGTRALPTLSKGFPVYKALFTCFLTVHHSYGAKVLPSKSEVVQGSGRSSEPGCPFLNQGFLPPISSHLSLARCG